MDSDAWSQHFSTTSKRHQSALQSRLDQYLGFEEVDVEDDLRPQFPCPFCFEDLDIVSLCCHIEDEHPVEAKNGVCPICGNRVGSDLVGHIQMQHGNFFKMQRRRRCRKALVGSHSTLSLLRKELRDGNLQSLLRGSSSVDSSSSTVPDPLLSSFIYNFPTADASKNLQPQFLDEATSEKETLNEKEEESVKPPPLSDKDQKERVQRSEFVQGLLISTILDEGDW